MTPSPVASPLQFRWHCIAAVVVGCLIAGNPHEVKTPWEIPWIIFLSLMMSWGPWVLPASAIYWIATPLIIVGMEIAKRSQPTAARSLALSQIVIWWSFWLLFGLAERFGRYIGP